MAVQAALSPRLAGLASPQAPPGRRDPNAAPLESAASFAEIARAMIVRGSVAQTEKRIVELAVAVIDGCDSADVMILDGSGQLRTVAYSNSSLYVAGLLQRHNHTGPSVTALSLGSCIVDDFATDQRWPRLSAWASSHGLASTCVCPLTTDRRALGVLNLYSTHTGVFTAEQYERAAVFAAHAALAIDSVWIETELSIALMSQQIISQAVGILMERHGLTAELALDKMVQASEDLHVTSLELAAPIVETGDESLLDSSTAPQHPAATPLPVTPVV